MPNHSKPMTLIILDGWGYSETSQSNAINAANKPVWDKLWAERPHSLIQGSGSAVGLPNGQMGNSEVGHLNLGAGRVVYQEITRVSRSIRTGSFFNNQTLTDAVDGAVSQGKAVHILGLLSPGGVHSHQDHILAMAELAEQRGADKIYLHAFLDGRDTPPKSAEASIKKMEDTFSRIGKGRFASVIGRYFAMDRDHRWPRIQSSYDLITQGKAGHQANSALDALNEAYARGETDEFVQATAIVPEGKSPVIMEDGDALIFMNYRSDRARQITRPFIEPKFDAFVRENTPKLSSFVSLTEYHAEFDVAVAFPPERLTNVFGEYLSNHGLRQLRIAETEKYAHVTFFFNGGRDDPYPGEDRILVNSPDVATYDLQPEMNCEMLTDKLIAAIEEDKYDVVICNFANPDMVGHTGDFDATVKAIEALDKCLGRIIPVIEKVGGEALITADHGNAEQMMGEGTGQAHTAHTMNPVPLIYIGQRELTIPSEDGTLADIAPTMIELMGMELPEEMGGHSLIEFTADNDSTQ